MPPPPTPTRLLPAGGAIVTISASAYQGADVTVAACTFWGNKVLDMEGGGLAVILPADTPSNMHALDEDCPSDYYREWSRSSTVTVTNCPFVNNVAVTGGGGAMFFLGGGAVTLCVCSLHPHPP